MASDLVNHLTLLFMGKNMLASNLLKPRYKIFEHSCEWMWVWIMMWR